MLGAKRGGGGGGGFSTWISSALNPTASVIPPTSAPSTIMTCFSLEFRLLVSWRALLLPCDAEAAWVAGAPIAASSPNKVPPATNRRRGTRSAFVARRRRGIGAARRAQVVIGTPIMATLPSRQLCGGGPLPTWFFTGGFNDLLASTSGEGEWEEAWGATRKASCSRQLVQKHPQIWLAYH